MDIKSKEEFEFFMQRALASYSGGTNNDDNYIELYNILLRSFAIADTDYDGQVSIEEFQYMIEAAASLPKKFGYDWWEGSSEDFFGKIDENGDGSITFDEWLSFALKHYQQQG